jgi:hypothetical protein
MVIQIPLQPRCLTHVAFGKPHVDIHCSFKMFQSPQMHLPKAQFTAACSCCLRLHPPALPALRPDLHRAQHMQR